MSSNQRYPATLPPQAQESIEDIVAGLQAYLVQREVSRQELQRQNEQLSASLQAERRVTDDLRRALAESERELERARRWARAWKRAAQQERGLAWTLGRDALQAERAAHEQTKGECEGYAEMLLSLGTNFASLERQLAETQQALSHTEARLALADAASGVSDE